MDTIGYNNWRRYLLKLFERTSRIIIESTMHLDERVVWRDACCYHSYMKSRRKATQSFEILTLVKKKTVQSKTTTATKQLSTINSRSLHPRHPPLVSLSKIYFVTILSRWVWRRLQRTVDSTWWRRHSYSCEDFKGVWLRPQPFFNKAPPKTLNTVSNRI